MYQFLTELHSYCFFSVATVKDFYLFLEIFIETLI